MRGLSLGREGDRDPELLRIRREIERRRHHAEDAVRLAAQSDVAPDDGSIGAEAARPQAMAEHDHLLFAGLVLGGRERPAERRLHAEDVEEPGRDACAGHALRGSLVREVEARILRGGELAERRRARAGVGEVAGGHAARPALIVLLDVDEPIGRGIGQRLQHDGVHRAEDRRGGADADREREQRDQRETGLRDEVPHGERDVLA